MSIVREEKAWGHVQHIFNDDQSAVSLLSVEAGTRCSHHRHHFRFNSFVSVSAEIVVEKFWPDPRVGVLEVLGPGQSCVVAPMIPHRFRVLKSGRVVEIYWVGDPQYKVSLEDIERFDEGGPDDTEELRRRLSDISEEWLWSLGFKRYLKTGQDLSLAVRMSRDISFEIEVHTGLPAQNVEQWNWYLADGSDCVPIARPQSRSEVLALLDALKVTHHANS